MSTFRETLVKSSVLGLLVGGISAIGVDAAQADASVVVLVKQFLGWPVEATKLFFSVANQSALFVGAHDFLLGPALPVTAGFVLSIKIAAALMFVRRHNRPAVDFLWPSTPNVLDATLEKKGADRILAVAASTQFLSRENEMQRLLGFANTNVGTPEFMPLTGVEGVGKTRLGLEWLKILKANGWDVGKLEPSKSALEIGQSAFRKKTAILIDEQSRRDDFWPRLDALLSKRQKIRILVADQFVLKRPDNLESQTRSRIDAASRGRMRLDRLSTQALTALAPSLPSRTRSEADGRPLYVLLGDDPTAELKERGAKRLALAGNNPTLELTLALAALAGPIGYAALKGIATTSKYAELEQLFEGEDKASLGQNLPALKPERFANEIVLRFAESQVPAKRDEFFSTAIRISPGAVEQRLANLWGDRKLDPDRGRIREDLQELFDAAAPDRVKALREDTQRLVNDAARKALDWPNCVEELHDLECVLAELSDIAATRPFDLSIRIHEAVGAINAMYAYGKDEKYFPDVERWGEHLITLTRDPVFEGCPKTRTEAALCEAKGAVNAIDAYCRDEKHFPDLERWGKHLIALTRDPIFHGDPKTRADAGRWEAKGAFNAMHAYSKDEKHFPDLERWGTHLIALARDPIFEGDPKTRAEVGLCEAEGAVRAMNAYCKHERRFQDLERWGRHLIALTRDPIFDGNPKIRAEVGLWEASGAVNAMNAYRHDEKHNPELERWGKHLIALTRDPIFEGDPKARTEVGLCEAKGAVNAMDAYGKDEKHIPELERWGRRLIALTRDPIFEGDPKARAEAGRLEAKGAFNAMSAYGKDKRHFPELERWGRHLIALTRDPIFEGYSKTRAEAGLEEAKGAVNAMNAYYKDGKCISELERWGKHLIGLTRDPIFEGDPYTRAEAALCEAKGALNAILSYYQVGQQNGTQAEFWRLRLARLALQFVGHPEIDEIAAGFDLTYAAQAARGWPYGLPPKMTT